MYPHAASRLLLPYILIFNMFLDGQIKLSRIFDHNFDKGTDRLYEPLRMAVESMPTAPSSSGELQQSMSGTALGEMKCSRINISRAEQDLIKNSTFIPINKKLVQTDNPEKRTRARSRSYRTLSVQQKIGSPMADAQFRQSVAQGGKKVEIVYDYDTNTHPKLVEVGKLAEYYGNITPSTMARTRSATYVGGMFASMMAPTNRAQTRMVQVERKPSINSSTSIQAREARQTARVKTEQQLGEYYEDCKKYTFKTEVKERTSLDKSNDSLERELIRSRMPAQNDYKYNLFNLLDEPINTKCSNGLCHKNEIIAPKIKKRW